MEMTVKINGRDVVFKKNGATMLLYKQIFGREYFADLAKIIKSKKQIDAAENKANPKAKKGKKTETEDEISDEELIAIAEQLENLNLEVYYNLLYVLAKSADPKLPDPLTWFGSFEEFDVITVFDTVSPMLARELSVDRKNVSSAAETETPPAD